MMDQSALLSYFRQNRSGREEETEKTKEPETDVNWPSLEQFIKINFPSKLGMSGCCDALIFAINLSPLVSKKEKLFPLAPTISADFIKSSSRDLSERLKLFHFSEADFPDDLKSLSTDFKRACRVNDSAD